MFKVYEGLLHDARFNDDEPLLITDAHEVAFRRLVVAASEAKTREVQRATSGFFHGEPYDMAPVAAKEIDLLLGSAAVLESKLSALRDAPLDKKNETAAMERQNTLQHYGYLSEFLCAGRAYQQRRPALAPSPAY